MGGENREQASLSHLGVLDRFDFLTMNKNSESQQSPIGSQARSFSEWLASSEADFRQAI
jgi:hypothetical protein